MTKRYGSTGGWPELIKAEQERLDRINAKLMRAKAGKYDPMSERARHLYDAAKKLEQKYKR